MADFAQGFLGSVQAGVEARNDVTVAVRNWFANRNPLVTRLSYVPVDRVDFQMYTHKYRTRATTLGASVTNNSITTVTLADATFLMNHDLIDVVDPVNGTERMQVNGDPTSSTTITVTRAVAGTTALSTLSNGVTVRLIGNSRTGAEVSQTGLTSVGQVRTQYCQTFQFPVQIGGSAESTRAAVLPGGIASPYDYNKTVQLQNMVDDMEVSLYYGIAQAPVDNQVPTSAVTAKMNGLKYILTTNNTTSPTNAGAYASSDLIRDTLQAARTNGGEPDLLVLSTNWMQALATWGQAVMRVPAGETSFGVAIDLFEAPFLHGVTIVEAPLLLPYTAIALTSSEVYIRPKRNPYWQPRGLRGDMVEGDWIAELGIEVVNESHHAWLEGVTAFSA